MRSHFPDNNTVRHHIKTHYLNPGFIQIGFNLHGVLGKFPILHELAYFSYFPSTSKQFINLDQIIYCFTHVRLIILIRILLSIIFYGDVASHGCSYFYLLFNYSFSLLLKTLLHP